MRELKEGEFEKAPPEIQSLYIRAFTKIPIGMSRYEELLKKYPEYFPDEIEHRRKWAAVPEEVKENYYKESFRLREEVYKDLPPSNGIIYWVDHPEEFAVWSEKQKACHQVYEPLEIDLYNKTFGPYGLSREI